MKASYLVERIFKHRLTRHSNLDVARQRICLHTTTTTLLLSVFVQLQLYRVAPG